MTIWIIRHAQSLSNAGQATVGPDDNVLSELGQQQAHSVAATVSHSPDWVVTSPYRRTQLTAQPLLKNFPHLRPEIWQVQEFTYLSLPLGASTTPLQRQPSVQAYWERCDPDYCDRERAESFRQLMQRVQQTLILIRQHEGFGIVFSHSLFIKALLWNLIAQPKQINRVAMQRFNGFWRSFRIPTASILQLEVLSNQQLSWSEFGVDHLSPSLQVEPAEMTTSIEVADVPT